MNQRHQQLDPKTIETLKAARNQVMQADSRNESENANPVRDKTPGASAQLSAGISNEANRGGSQNPREAQFGERNKFAEEFVQKLASIERETAAVDEEMAKAEKLWSSLVEKKKQLEARRNELIKVKDKLKELDKEMSEVLKSQ